MTLEDAVLTLFNKSTRSRIIQFMLENPKYMYLPSYIAKELNLCSATVYPPLRKLNESQILYKQDFGNVKLYSLAKNGITQGIYEMLEAFQELKLIKNITTYLA